MLKASKSFRLYIVDFLKEVFDHLSDQKQREKQEHCEILPFQMVFYLDILNCNLFFCDGKAAKKSSIITPVFIHVILQKSF